MKAKVEKLAAVAAAATKAAKGSEKVEKPLDAKAEKAVAKVAKEEQKKEKVAKAKTPFGHWRDSARGRLDEAMAEGGTLDEIAEKCGVTIGRVRSHIGDLRAQERGEWGPKVVVTTVDGKVSVKLA